MKLTAFIANIALAASLSVYSSSEPQVFIGKEYGDILRCSFKEPNNCETFYTDSYLHNIGDQVKFLTVYREYIFAALSETKKILQCELTNNLEIVSKARCCKVFYEFDSVISSMTTARGGHVLIGLWDGKVLRCSLRLNSCSVLYMFDEWIASVVEFNETIYVASGFMLSRCFTHDCTIVAELMELAITNNTLFALTSDNRLWKCGGKLWKAGNTNFCEQAELPGDGRPRTMTSFNGNLYIAYLNSSNPIISCKWRSPLTNYNRLTSRTARAVSECSEYLKHPGAKIVAFTYATQQLKCRFWNEENSCSWQDSKSPPYVNYYDVIDRSVLEVSVSNGKLYDSRGFLVDIADADVGNSGPAAIFVMAPEGRLFLSKTQAKYLLHTSSLLAGQPMSGAGEMVVVKGVIKNITNCSQQYEPTLSFNAQVIHSLRYQGYTAPIPSKRCHE